MSNQYIRVDTTVNRVGFIPVNDDSYPRMTPAEALEYEKGIDAEDRLEQFAEGIFEGGVTFTEELSLVSEEEMREYVARSTDST